MGKRVLLVGDTPGVAAYAERARAIGMDPVCVEASAGHEALLRAARDSRVHGIRALSAESRAAAAGVAELLHMPGEGSALHFSEWDRLRDAGIAVVENRVARDDATAARALHELEVPLWVKAASLRAEPFCMTLQHPDDLPLALANVRKRASGEPFLLQKPAQGPCFRLMGFQLGRAFHAVEVVGERVHDERFRVPVELALPCRVGAAAYQTMVDVGHLAAPWLPPGHYPLEMRFVLCEGRPVLTDVSVPTRFETALAELLWHGLAVDVRAALLRVAVGEPPHTVPRRYLGAAARWLSAASGAVRQVQGVEEARAMPGVQRVEVAVAPGDTLGHVVDRAARDRTGYVLATGGSDALALARAQDAAARVNIETARAW